MPPKIPNLDWWKLDNQPLALPHENTLTAVKTSENPRDLTGHAVDIIRQSSFKKAVDLIAESDKLVRPLELKQVGNAFNQTPANFDLSRQERQAAAAAYMMRPGTNHEDCKQCADQQRAKGPCKECIADNGLFKGACFNCHYSGRSGSCSFVTEQKKLIASETESTQKRKRVAASHFSESNQTKLIITEKDLRETKTSELERWISIMQGELARRRTSTATIIKLRDSDSPPLFRG